MMCVYIYIYEKLFGSKSLPIDTYIIIMRNKVVLKFGIILRK